MAPSLPAAQPATYTFEGRESAARQGDDRLRVDGRLDEKQRAQAVLGERVADLVLGAGQDGG